MLRQLFYILLFLLMPCHGFTQTWSPVGNGFFSVYTPTCFSAQEKLYIGANGVLNYNLCGMPFNALCSFDGTKIDTFGSGVAFGYPYDVKWYNGKLIVAGNFAYAGQSFQVPFSTNIAAWDSITGWSSITPAGGCNASLKCITIYNNDLYAGGQQTQINGVLCSRIAKWNGTAWSDVAGGLTGSMGTLYCMTIYHGELYVGGNFTTAGGVPAYYIARWNGTQWDSVGRGFNNYVKAMTVDTVNDILYAAGGFTRAGNATAFGIAQWNDTTWSAVGIGTDTLWGTQCLAMFNGELFAGGGNVTITSQGDTINNIYKYNGTKWISVDGGANNTVDEMCVFQGNLYIGGYFWQVGNAVFANRIACYGTTCPQGVGISEQIPPVPFRMFPNPTDDVLHIESEEPQQMIFRLIGSDGKLIAEGRFFSKMDYSIKKLASGNYFVQIGLEDGSRVHTEKLIVK